MQPEHTEPNQDSSTNQDQSTNSSTHHGFRASHASPSRLHSSESGGEASASIPSTWHEQPRSDDKLSRSGQDSPRKLSSPRSSHYGDTENLDELVTIHNSSISLLSSTAGSPVDRITKYERATTPPPTSGDHGTFKIIPRAKSSSQSGPKVTDFPNEVLTHIFSHLPPATLSAAALVSQRFHSLVTTPHPWRDAFSRYFPGPEILVGKKSLDREDTLVSARRHFTRLTALASWRSEYILRTRLLRSLSRGKPSEVAISGNSESPRSNQANTRNAQLTYCSRLFTTVNHLHATFGNDTNRRPPKFIHGADESGTASSSNSSNGIVDAWGFGDPESFLQFAERFPGDSLYGLGSGDVVGVPNSMDVSQPYGMIHGEGSPGGAVYYRHPEEHRGRILASSSAHSFPELGIPKLDATKETICSVWIAKSSSLPDITDGLIGLIAGSSYGILTSYSLGTNGLRGRRIERGEVTARWVLSPGVPIIAIAVDENYNLKRLGRSRVWATVLNALGEVFYLNTLPIRPEISALSKLSIDMLDRFAWDTGRTASWSQVEPTQRKAKIDPYYIESSETQRSARSSCVGVNLEKEPTTANTRYIENMVKQRPSYFRSLFDGWDMQRKLEVDFAGDDENGAGEAVFVLDCGLEENQEPQMKRYTRLKFPKQNDQDPANSSPPSTNPVQSHPSIFGSSQTAKPQSDASSTSRPVSVRKGSVYEGETASEDCNECWVTSELSFGNLRRQNIVCTTTDTSSYALLTVNEDPLLNMSTSNASSPWSSPAGNLSLPGKPSELAGHRSRFIAVGTKSGNVAVWDMRAPTAQTAQLINIIEPLRVIFTDSPEISCLALSALYLVHGGNDGLVQLWDPLASTTQPIRTINKRFSSRARDRLHQGVGATPGVGITLCAAGAICLDPDPTVLRGMVSLGKNLRYWSYSSTAADQYKSSKRRLRRSQRGNNHTSDSFRETPHGRASIRNYITSEQLDLEAEEKARRREAQRLAGRFGLDLLGHGATEEEIMAYATMLSEEAAESDRATRTSGSFGSDIILEASASPLGAASPSTSFNVDDVENDHDIAEAIRLSLQESAQVPVRYVKGRRSSPGSSPLTAVAPATAGSSRQPEEDDLDFALQLSLAEEKSRLEVLSLHPEEFPPLERSSSDETQGKGKGKARSS